MAKPQISIVVCTYERPENLRRVLTSIEGQRGVDGAIEVIVADDGSQDETEEVFQQFRRRVNFPARFVTHDHGGFCPGRCRNEGVAASRADYLLLLDGDCLLPPDHVRIHLARRRRGVVRMGDCLRLSEEDSCQITEEMALSGTYPSLGGWSERWRLWRKACLAAWHNFRRHPWKPVLISNNVGIWSDDYYRVNGFDENYVGWGCEDDDFGRRLRRAGLALQSILWWTHTFHLWHPPHPSAPARWSEGPNVEYFLRGFRLTRCGNGLVQRSPRDIGIQLIGNPAHPNLLRRVLPTWCRLQPPKASTGAEIEVLFAPSEQFQFFTGRADCNVLVVPEAHTAYAPQYVQAHLVLSDHPWPQIDRQRLFGLNEFEAALQYLLTNRRQPISSTRLAA